MNFYIEPVAAYNRKTPANDPSKIFLNCPASILNEFKKLLAGTSMLGATFTNPYTGKKERLPADVEQLTSSHLQILARNEHVNVNGRMKTELYNGLLTDDSDCSPSMFGKSNNCGGSC